MPSSGLGRRLFAGGDLIGDDDLLPAMRRTQTAPPAVLGNYWWGSGTPAVAEIPVTWLSGDMTLRLERPYTHAEVTQAQGSTARADATTVDIYSVFPFTATLNTAVDADATNLAHWTVTYNANPRMRCPSLTVNLLYRTTAEKAFLLGIGRGRRIRITGLPAQWPEGADTLVVRGIQHQIATYGHSITFVTGPAVGAVPGQPGPWFRWNTSNWGGTDVRPF